MRRWFAATALAIAALAALWGGSAASDQSHPELAALFESLLRASDSREASLIEDAIWEFWLESGDESIDRRMAAGIRALGAGDHVSALRDFDAIVEAAPGFAEGWNKRATLYWLMGRPEESLRDIARTLALEPRHFGALSGLAMIRESQGQPFEALEALERLLRIHPQLPHLKLRIDRLTRQLGEPV